MSSYYIRSPTLVVKLLREQGQLRLRGWKGTSEPREDHFLDTDATFCYPSLSYVSKAIVAGSPAPE